MESGKLGLISCTTNPVLEEGDNSTTSEITIKIKHEGQGTTSSSQGHEEIHTMLQSPGGSSHFIKGLVVANAASETISSSQLQTVRLCYLKKKYLQYLRKTRVHKIFFMILSKFRQLWTTMKFTSQTVMVPPWSNRSLEQTLPVIFFKWSDWLRMRMVKP